MIATLAALARAHLDAGRPLRTRVQGHSMWPLLRDGQTVTIVPLLGPPRVGDVVLVEARTILVLHRVIDAGREHAVTKGDAEPEPDGRVARDAILGRLVGGSSCLVAHASRLAGPLGARALSGLRRLVARVARDRSAGA